MPTGDDRPQSWQAAFELIRTRGHERRGQAIGQGQDHRIHALGRDRVGVQIFDRIKAYVDHCALRTPSLKDSHA